MSLATVHRRAVCTHRSRPRLLLALGQTGGSIIRLICICFFQCLCSMSEASHMASTNLLQSRAEVFFGSTALVFLAKPNQLLMMLPIKWQQTTQVDVLRTTTNKRCNGRLVLTYTVSSPNENKSAFLPTSFSTCTSWFNIIKFKCSTARTRHGHLGRRGKRAQTTSPSLMAAVILQANSQSKSVGDSQY